MTSRCGFNLCFPDYQLSGISFSIFVGHSDFFSSEFPVHALCAFSHQPVCVFLNDFRVPDVFWILIPWWLNELQALPHSMNSLLNFVYGEFLVQKLQNPNAVKFINSSIVCCTFCYLLKIISYSDIIKHSPSILSSKKKKISLKSFAFSHLCLKNTGFLLEKGLCTG